MKEDLTVLVVEDNPGDVDLIVAMLPETRPVRFIVEPESRLSGAIRRLERGGIDVVLLDLGLPDSQGIDTVRAVAGAAPHVPIVVITGQNDEETGQAAVREGAQDYLVKWALPEWMLARVLRYAVERHHTQEDLRLSQDALRKAHSDLEARVLDRTEELSRANAALSRSEGLLRLQKEQMPVGCMTLDEDLQFTEVNAAAERVFGFKADELIGKHARVIVAPRARQHVEDLIRRAKAGDMTMHSINENLTADGRTIVCEWLNTPLKDEQGRSIGMLSMASDITERKRTEVALSRSESCFKLLSETAGRLLAAGDPREIAYDLCRRVMQHLDCHVFFNYLLDEKAGRLRLNAYDGIPEEEAGEIDCLDYGVAVCGCAAQDSLRIVAEDIFHTPDPRTELVKSYGIQAYACYPLLAQGRLLGTLSFGAKTRTRFTPEDLDLMQSVADHVTNAEQRMKLIEDLRQSRDELDLRVKERTGELEAANTLLRKEITERRQLELVRLASLTRQERLNRLQQALLAPGGMDRKLKMITDGVVEIFGADFSRIWCIAPGDMCELGCIHAAAAEGPQACLHRGGCLHLIASSGRYVHTDGAVHRRVPVGAYTIGLLAAGQEHRLLTNDVTRDTRAHDRDWARELGLVSFAGYQLRPSAGETLGVLALFKKDVITPEEDAQLDALSATAATVIQAAQAEEALRQSEEKYHSLYENMTQGVFFQSADGAFIDANPAALSMFGLRREELLGRTSFDSCWDVIHDDGSPFPAEERPSMMALKAGKPVHDVVAGVFNPQKQSYVWMTVNAIPQYRQGETVPYRVFVTLHDITMRKRAEEALKRAEARYRSIFDNTVEGIFQATPEGKFLSVNPSLAGMCGFGSPDEMVATITDIQTQLYVNPEDRTKIATLYERDGGVRSFETQFRKTDGRQICVSINSRAVRDEHGNMLYYEGTIEDVTELKQAEKARTLVEAQLRQAQKMEALGTLAGGIAHDFNNILGIISGYTEMAKWDAAEGSSLESNLMQVLNATHRAKDLVRQILAFARQSEQERRPVHVGLVVKDATKMLRASLPSTIDIKVNVDSKTAVLGDPTQIHQVLMNLCTNAAHAMRESEGVLEVNLADVRLGRESIFLHSGMEPGPYVKLTVKDTGHGIDPAMLDRIFDPFFTTKEQGVGTGLGLAVVHGIVKSHGGAIEVESLPGKGSIFQVFLPAMESAPVIEKVETLPLPGGSERILVVDDEPTLAEIMKQMLERLGYEVDSRTSSLEALEAFSSCLLKKPFDLVVTDMTMPHITGVNLALELLRLQPNLPILLCTGFSEKIDAEKTRTVGIKGLLMKPVVLRQLAEMVRKALDERTE